MDSCSVYGDDHPHLKNALLKNEASEDLDSLWPHDSSNPSFHGSASPAMVNFEDVRGEDSPSPQKPIFPKIGNNAGKTRNSEELILDAFSSQKKRRLSSDQVRFLDKSFEVDNKLEPERKVQLAKELGLQPRQVAIWFQNRRARYKTKLLEKDYDALKSNYDRLKEDFDALYSENEKLKTEVNTLAEKLLGKADHGDHRPIKEEPPFDDDVNKQTKASSAKSDVLDYSDADGGNQRSPTMLELEHGDSSHVVGAISDYEDDDSLGRSLLLEAGNCLTKIEESFYDDLQPNSNCNLGFPVQNNHGTWFWQV
uniref:Homeobox-leucine zipper protein n=1 Tax=Craterostigma plantagineum TaxID=4153 RepID=Q8W1K2_CRAPL|nr:homeodomain leucine zipper protein CPHB-7 [Craterostigma plantagineum]ABA39174.1 HDZip transcription factor HB-7 [Craterostigma plantagineum]